LVVPEKRLEARRDAGHLSREAARRLDRGGLDVTTGLAERVGNMNL